jgi:hypothetical protein
VSAVAPSSSTPDVARSTRAARGQRLGEFFLRVVIRGFSAMLGVLGSRYLHVRGPERPNISNDLSLFSVGE